MNTQKSLNCIALFAGLALAFSACSPSTNVTTPTSSYKGPFIVETGVSSVPYFISDTIGDKIYPIYDTVRHLILGISCEDANGMTYAMRIGANGLPNAAKIGVYLFTFYNYTDSSVDMAFSDTSGGIGALPNVDIRDLLSQVSYKSDTIVASIKTKGSKIQAGNTGWSDFVKAVGNVSAASSDLINCATKAATACAVIEGSTGGLATPVVVGLAIPVLFSCGFFAKDIADLLVKNETYQKVSSAIDAAELLHCVINPASCFHSKAEGAQTVWTALNFTMDNAPDFHKQIQTTSSWIMWSWQMPYSSCTISGGPYFASNNATCNFGGSSIGGVFVPGTSICFSTAGNPAAVEISDHVTFACFDPRGSFVNLRGVAQVNISCTPGGKFGSFQCTSATDGYPQNSNGTIVGSFKLP